MMKRREMIIGACTALVLSSASQAQPTWPTKPVRLIFPYSAGGGGDAAARVIANGIANQLGQPVIVDNRTGANGRIGTEVVAKSTPDGYTVLITAAGPITITPNLERVPYDPLKDLAPIGLAVRNDAVLVVHKTFPASTVKEFVELIKRSPGKYSYATAGAGGGPHLAMELFKSRAQIQVQHVPYRGDGPAVSDVIAGHVPIGVNALSSVAPFLHSGDLKAIATMGPVRYPTLPDLPTLSESGYPGFRGGTWLGLFAPAGTPPIVIQRLSEAMRHAVQDPATNERLVATGNTPVGGTPDEFRRFIAEESANYARIIKSAQIKID
jgi:tripartite-type tricarboxylate transporter receptor subunit TctC